MIKKLFSDCYTNIVVNSYLIFFDIPSFSSVLFRIRFLGLIRVSIRVGTGRSARPDISASWAQCSGRLIRKMLYFQFYISTCAGVFDSTSSWRDFNTVSSASTFERTRSLVSLQESGRKSGDRKVPVVKFRLKRISCYKVSQRKILFSDSAQQNGNWSV